MRSAKEAASRRDDDDATRLPLPLSYAPMEARGLAQRRFVLDGEIVIPVDGALSFEELQLRLHPAASRVAKLAAAHPCRYIVFDLLVGPDGDRLSDLPLSERRVALKHFFAALDRSHSLLELSPAVTSVVAARRWLEDAGSDLDGIIAKQRALPYASGERDAMVKFKTLRTVDCVVGGFRYGSNSRLVGSLLLGLYDADGKLNHVGLTSSIAARDKADTTKRLEASSRASWPRCASITFLEDASATARVSCAGVPTRRRSNAEWSRSGSRSAMPGLSGTGRGGYEPRSPSDP